MNCAVISLGSNIQPEYHLQKICEILSKEFTVTARSSWQRTVPVGLLDQADFLNGVVVVSTDLSMDQLAGELKKMEILGGRISRAEKFGPREIDLDILIWNGKVVNPDYYERLFLRELTAEVIGNINLRCY